ncbi:lytic transglycosylase domain-containing protein [uncultured Nitratireductor sp.]|uniref:lytic transglycosylase domain-containing protein n=1 Tax=uncultured Nitratireductor sp. TaxID=520953 RepID=UPI0025D12F89|nr:lytic transglycosylase domain-containing protein [uncultured Nitratireductor sp.]
MRFRVATAIKSLIPLFAKYPSHPAVPLGHRTAGARSEDPGRPLAGALRAPLTAASTLAGWRHSGDRARSRYTVCLLAAVLTLGSGSSIAVAQSTLAVRPAAINSYAAHVVEASQRFGIPEHWIRAVLRAESAGDARAISSAGAMGLMQVMPDTWSELRIRHGLGRDPYDARDNILAGVAYLREMWDRYGNVAAMLAAYNAGPARYDEYLAAGRTLPAETRAYIAALAPVLGGDSATEPSLTAPPSPPDWREAPLFVTRPAVIEAAAARSSGSQSGGLFAVASERDRR